ncbi:copper-transporting ATPase [[Candida] anglica]|uniref:Copper-transporting ATPase n=1 Tax=[Candida] anglica TaxID=148631 RepID=A0ABP0EBL3_9ASCO
MEVLTVRLGNIHCDDCRIAVANALAKSGIKIQDSSKDHVPNSYHIEDNNVIVYGSNLQPKTIIKNIVKNGFKVLSWDATTEDDDTNEELSTTTVIPSTSWWSKFQDSRQKRSHLKHCSKCKEEQTDQDSELTAISPVVEKQEREFRVVFSVEGMTCASCVHDVEEKIGTILSDAGVSLNDTDKQPNYSVSLISHTAVVVLPNKQLINKIVDGVYNIGFECKLVEALPVERSINTKIVAIIGGMTCAACSNSIRSAAIELPFVLECGINLVSKTGQFVMEYDPENLEKLKETVEECGFDFEVVTTEQINYTSTKKRSRTINVSVDGMFCSHCPEIVMDYLNSYGEAVVIDDPITLDHPYIKFTYLPNPESGIHIRKFLDDISHLEADSTDPLGYKIDKNNDESSFKATLVQPISMDEHLRELSKREVFNIVRRLILATVFAVPTFIFGIVGMSLLPKSNNFRIWVDEPLWVGAVSRSTWILFILSTPVYFFAADIFHIKALKELKALWFYKNSFRKRLFRFGSMSLLMCLGTSVSYFASIVLLILSSQKKNGMDMREGITMSYFDSVVFLTFFLLIGRLLESFSKSKTADAIASLSKLKVTQAHLVDRDNDNDEEDKVVDVKFLEVGDLIRVVSGDSPPVDCTVVEGQSEFDEAALTGESKPVKHTSGHQIFSGTVNVGNEAIIAKITSLEGDSLLDQIVNTVRDGQLRKAPIARTADLLTGYFVPVIVFLAVLTWVIWISLGYSGSLPEHYLDTEIGGWAVWSLEFCIAVFVIACPCGIGLAAPTALFVGSGLAAKYGILAKGGGIAFQDGANTNVVCFDKTGTLTYGELQVTDYLFTDDEDIASKTFSLQAAKDLELVSKHPLAKSVKSFLNKYGFPKNNITATQNKIPQVENVPGKGLRGYFVIEETQEEENSIWTKYSPSEALLGNEALLHDYNVEISTKQSEILTRWKSECKSVVLVAIRCKDLYGDDLYHLSFMMACRDQIRAETKTVVSSLQKSNIECWMITGDNKLTAKAIGKEIGISEDRIVSEVLPDEKQAQVQKIQKLSKGKRNIVAMVGDGINDAPAMASADLGIALSSGADLAVTSSDFIILNRENPLVTLVTLLDLSRTIFRRVKFNFGWSLVYNMIGIPVAAGVIYPYNNTRLSPVWASAAMALSSISVVLSSLALKFYTPRVKAVEELELEEEEPRKVTLQE